MSFQRFQSTFRFLSGLTTVDKYESLARSAKYKWDEALRTKNRKLQAYDDLIFRRTKLQSTIQTLLEKRAVAPTHLTSPSSSSAVQTHSSLVGGWNSLDLTSYTKALEEDHKLSTELLPTAKAALNQAEKNLDTTVNAYLDAVSEFQKEEMRNMEFSRWFATATTCVLCILNVSLLYFRQQQRYEHQNFVQSLEGTVVNLEEQLANLQETTKNGQDSQQFQAETTEKQMNEGFQALIKMQTRLEDLMIMNLEERKSDKAAADEQKLLLRRSVPSEKDLVTTTEEPSENEVPKGTEEERREKMHRSETLSSNPIIAAIMALNNDRDSHQNEELSSTSTPKESTRLLPIFSI
eukprot:g288.t1